MHLPKILMERYGWAGFVAFAAPNVLGCAAFGYVLKNHDRSEAFALRHVAAMRWFSFVTIAFHVFFIASFVRSLPWSARFPMVEIGLALVVLLAGLTLSALRDRGWLIVTAMIYAGSLAAFATIATGTDSALGWSGARPPAELAWLVPVMCFGFLLCPYMDLTFHRALQRSPSRHSFAIFGVAFFVMILMTAVYWADPSRAAGLWLAHLLAQSTFTVSAHLRELERDVAARPWMPRRRWLWVLPLAALLAYAPAGGDSGPYFWEANYLRFLVFYGLAFPTYVLFAAWAWAGRWPGRAPVAILILATVLSMPLLELGFNGQRTWLTSIPVIVLCFGAVVARRARPLPP